MSKNLQNLNFFAVFAPQKLKEHGSTILQFSLILLHGVGSLC